VVDIGDRTNKLGRSSRKRAIPGARESVRLPNGRFVYGMLPGYAGSSREEHRLRDKLAHQLRATTKAITEARLPFHLSADVMTESAVFEVEPRCSWRHGASQALGYAVVSGLPPALALFGAARREEVLEIYIEIRNTPLQGAVAPIELWWWAGNRWDRIISRSCCTNMPRGARFGSCNYCGETVAWQSIDGSVDCYEYSFQEAVQKHHCQRMCYAKHIGRMDCIYWLAEITYPSRKRGESCAPRKFQLAARNWNPEITE
jgi:hypothetical protein